MHPFTDHVEATEQAQAEQRTDRSPDRSEGEEPSFRVNDRRWWAQAQSEPADSPVTSGSEAAERKPTHVAQLEAEIARLNTQLQDKDRQIREAVQSARGTVDELERAKERIRKDAARELEQKRRDILTGFLEVLDDLDRALAAGRKGTSDAVMLEGVELVRKSFLAKLGQLGASPMGALGQRFDPERHDAVSMMPAADAAQDGVVLAVVREGYLIGDEVLRPAQVVVGKRAG